MKHTTDAMSVRSDRRGVLKLACSAALIICLPACAKRPAAADVEEELAALEQRSGGRLGAGIMGVQSGTILGHRADERFALCSTFKLPLAAVILMEADAGRLELGARVPYSRADLVPYAPVTEKHLDRGYMSVVELAEAAQTTSDNVAANLLLRLVGGPSGFTEKLRAFGDDTTRLDRYEPELNYVPIDEIRDTTSPMAMAATLGQILTGPGLSSDSKYRLRAWMENTQTGLKRLRAGFPADWRAGDKTGTAYSEGMASKYNDIAAAWPHDGTPDFIVTAYYEADGEYDHIRDQDVAVLEQVGKIAANAFQAT